MNESGKWRSGRELLRDAISVPPARGGETPHAFSDDEREAAEHDRNVVVPAGKAPSFVMVETISRIEPDSFSEAFGLSLIPVSPWSFA